MSPYLLDTHTALLALTDPAELKPAVRSAILSGRNVLSVVYWEVLLKSMKGKLQVGDPRTWWLDALDQLAATPLPLRPDHVSAVYHLPPIHQDPFDRVLIAQETVEGFALVTTDHEISRYAGERLRVIG